MQVSTNLIAILLLLGGVASLQFFKGRRLNATIMIHYIRKFEENLKLKDKLYTYLGGSIGFKAKFDLDDKNFKSIDLVLTLLPRQSLFWLPFSYPIKRGDRLYVKFYPRFRIRRDVHIVQNFYYLFGPDIKERDVLKKERATVGKYNNFYTLYENKEDFDRIKRVVEMTFSNPRRVRHIALNKETNSVFLLIKPDLQETPKELNKLLNNLPKVFEDWAYFKD